MSYKRCQWEYPLAPRCFSVRKKKQKKKKKAMLARLSPRYSVNSVFSCTTSKHRAKLTHLFIALYCHIHKNVSVRLY